jgi:prevent-host-death family protein
MSRTRVSVAEARQSFARLIRDAQRGRAVEITRRGEPVAVLLSASQYLALTGERPSFIEAATRLRDRMDVESLGIGDADFEDLRETASGRRVSL